MLFSYQQAADGDLPAHTKRFVQAAVQTKTPQGLVLGPQALSSYVESLVGVQELVDSVTDDESVARVDHELRRRFLTGRIPEDVTEALVEALEVLGLDEQLKVSDIPLVAMLSTDQPVDGQQVIINVVGRKSLADAVRNLYARLYIHPYPSSVPDASIILYRMPPLEGTAHVALSGDQAVVQAVRGWGRLVGVSEVADTYTLRMSGAMQHKQVRAQDSMVYRNPRSGEIVQTRPRDATSQKLTDDEARTMVLAAKRLGLAQAVFGFSDEKTWLLRVPEQAAPNAEQQPETEEKAVPEPEPAHQPETSQEDYHEQEPQHEEQEPPQEEDEQEDPEIVIVDFEDAEDEPEDVREDYEREPAKVEDDSAHEADASPARQEPSSDADAQAEQEPEVDEEQEDSWSPADVYGQPEPEVPADANAQELHDASVQTASALLEQSLGAIELTMREWLRGEQPEGFEELVRRVSARRQVPYKNRVLTLHEMRGQGAFERPSPEAVRFALETLDRFRKEF